MYDLKITNNFYLDNEDVEIIKNHKSVDNLETYYTKEDVTISKMDKENHSSFLTRKK